MNSSERTNMALESIYIRDNCSLTTKGDVTMSMFKKIFIGIGCFFAMTVSGVGNATGQHKLGLNDVSWLWPAPVTTTDLDNIIAVADLNSIGLTKTSVIGGSGGESFDVDCGVDSVLVGLTGRSGAWLDQIQAICVQVDESGKWIGSPTKISTPKGGDGGLAFSQQCEEHHAVAGISGGVIDEQTTSLQTHCRRLLNANSTTGNLIGVTGTAGGAPDDGNILSVQCSETAVAKGIHGKSANFLDNLGLNCAENQPVWSDKHFQDLLTAIDSGLTNVEGNQVQFGSDIRSKSVWRVAGMRVDPCAPGCSATVDPPFNKEKTQIRLIVQPVTDGPNVHDVAVHLVYSWVDSENQNIRNDKKFREILLDLDQLKIESAEIGASTAGLPLGVHPGLLTDNTDFHNSIKSFLEKHLSEARLDSIALMGIQQGIEPWFFLALSRLGDTFGKIPLPIPSAAPQMIDFRQGGRVAPEPIVSNRPQGGVATAVLFKQPFVSRDAFAVVGKDSAGNDILDSQVRNRDIPDIIASPIHSHFFNTDCVSCHTESRRRMRLNLPVGDFAFKPDGQPPQIAQGLLPQDDWNVRNFGWFTPHRFIGGGPTVATVTQRSANETQEVVEFIERNFRAESLH